MIRLVAGSGGLGSCGVDNNENDSSGLQQSWRMTDAAGEASRLCGAFTVGCSIDLGCIIKGGTSSNVKIACASIPEIVVIALACIVDADDDRGVECTGYCVVIISAAKGIFLW